MASVIDGGTWDEPTYNIDIKIRYKGIYSKFVDEFYLRGEHNLIEQWGMSIRSDYTRYSQYSFYRSLDKHYPIDLIDMIDIDSLIRSELVRKGDVNISENDVILHEREIKMLKLRKQMKKEKSIPFRIKKFFKRK